MSDPVRPRRVLGVEVVNLIWRHLATIPNALPWAWGMLRPLYAGGTIAAEAHVLHDRLSLPRLPPFPPDLLYAIELHGSDVVSIRNILAAYDRTNAMALVALSALLCRLEAQPATSEPIAELSWKPSPEPLAGIPLPPLPGLDALPEPVANLVLTLNRLGTARQSRSRQHVSSSSILARLPCARLGADRAARCGWVSRTGDRRCAGQGAGTGRTSGDAASGTAA